MDDGGVLRDLGVIGYDVEIVPTGRKWKAKMKMEDWACGDAVVQQRSNKGTKRGTKPKAETLVFGNLRRCGNRPYRERGNSE
jgi:hypothetical protein